MRYLPTDLVAYLLSHCIYVYTIDVIQGRQVSREILQIPPDKGWKGVVLAGPYVVAWGYSKPFFIEVVDVLCLNVIFLDVMLKLLNLSLILAIYAH